MSDQTGDGIGATSTEDLTKFKNLTIITHCLYAAGVFLGITAVVGVIIAYIKRGETAGSIYQSHMTYAIRTFWWGTLFGIIGLFTTFLIIGFPILIFGTVQYLVRVVRALLAIFDDKAIANPKSFF